MIETIYESSQSTAGVMFDIKAKGNNGENVVVYGLDVNFVDKVYVRGGPSMRVLIYTREGTFKGHEGSESGWDLWMNTTVVSSGLDEATPVPQTAEEAEKVVPLLVGAKERRAFYVSVDGPYLRYSDQVSVRLLCDAGQMCSSSSFDEHTPHPYVSNHVWRTPSVYLCCVFLSSITGRPMVLSKRGHLHQWSGRGQAKGLGRRDDLAAIVQWCPALLHV